MNNIYISRDNIVVLLFKKDDVIMPLNAITQIDLVIEDLDTTISNSVAAQYPIKWLHDPVEEGVLKLKIGNLTTTVDGVEESLLSNGLYRGKFYIYSLDYSNGIYWNEIELLIDT